MGRDFVTSTCTLLLATLLMWLSLECQNPCVTDLQSQAVLIFRCYLRFCNLAFKITFTSVWCVCYLNTPCFGWWSVCGGYVSFWLDFCLNYQLNHLAKSCFLWVTWSFSGDSSLYLTACLIMNAGQIEYHRANYVYVWDNGIFCKLFWLSWVCTFKDCVKEKKSINSDF